VDIINNKIFRKKSIDKINSPEQLNEFITVSKPSIWLLLAAIILLLIGVCVWGVFGTLETKESVVISVNNGVGHLYLTYDQLDSVSEGMTVYVNDSEGTVTGIDYAPVNVNDGWYYDASVRINISDGVYTSQIITDSVAPIYFLFN
jgi:hypothetical protein